MSILVTGATGTIGSLIVQRLAEAGADVKALVRQRGKAGFPPGVTEVVGDLTDVPSMRAALSSVRTLFLLNAVTPDELTQAVIALNLAREAGIERVVYLSVIHAEQYTNVPHFTGKHAVERMIESLDIPATILRPAYFMQNERMVQQAIQGYGVYPMPIGTAGVSMVDVRDISDVAGAELLTATRVVTAVGVRYPTGDRSDSARARGAQGQPTLVVHPSTLPATPPTPTSSAVTSSPPPAATAEKGSTWELPTARTALVEQFCSWSAWRMNSTSSAFTNTGFPSYFDSDIRATIERKFST